MAGIDPMHQFQISKVVEIPPVNVPGLGLVDLSITNSVVAMMLAALFLVVFLLLSGKREVVPGRMQVAGESVYGLVDDLVDSMIGHGGRPFFPFVFTLFAFVLFMNMLGMFMVFTATSQLAVTATLAVLTIATVIIVGFAKNGLKFFKLFVPSGVPWPVLIILVPIEIISFLIRPLTLALRLFGNMLGGHIVLKIFAAFVVALGGVALSADGGALAKTALVPAALSFSMVVALTALEFLVAFLQAFVFASLTCVYLNDVVHLDSH